MEIGILVHGRHIEAQGWRYMMWGNPPYQFGLLPRLIQTALQYNLDNIQHIIIGSGVKTKTGQYESEHILEFLQVQWNTLDKFDDIGNLFLAIPDRDAWKSRFFSKIILDRESQNTQQEIINASKSLKDCTQILQITSCSHAPRCIKTTTELINQTIIPSTPIWMVVPDMTPYHNTTPSDVCIMEPPHRIDDPFINESLRPNQVFQKLYNIKNHEVRVKVLRDLEESIERNQ